MVSVVTGGASGLGRALVRLLANNGNDVALLDVEEERGQRVAGEVGATFFRCDVSSRARWTEVAVDISSRMGTPDFVALNAGVMTRPPSATLGDDIFEWVDRGAYDKIMRTNVDGVVYGLEAMVPLMGDGGAIVVTASAAGLIPFPADPFYAATKHALVGIVRSFGPVLVEKNIRLNAFCPGGIDTAIVPDDLKQFADLNMPAEESARAIMDIKEMLECGAVFVKTTTQPTLERFDAPEIPL